jgi:hypothetical protein
MTTDIKVKFTKIPIEEKQKNTYIKLGFTLKNDSITGDLNNFYLNGDFNHQDDNLTLNDIFEPTENAWINGIYDLDYDYKKIKFTDMKISEIKTGSTSSVEKMVTVLNIIKTKPENYTIGYIFKNHRMIFRDIFNHRLNSTKNITTFKNDISPLVYFFKNFNNENDIFLTNQYKIYKALESDLNFYLKETKADNVLTESFKGKYVKYEKLLEVLPKIKTNLDNFINVKSADYKRLHMQHLYLSLTLLSPTLRKEYRNMKITDDITATTDKKYDFLYIPSTGFIKYIFNLEKKGHTTAPYELGILNNKKENYTGQQITDIVKESYNMFPRMYVLETFTINKPYSLSSVDSLLTDILEDKNLGINAIRASFGTFAVASKNSSNVTKNCADKMRTSVDMLYSNYKKLDNSSGSDNEAGTEPKVTNIIEKVKPNKQVTMKKYYDDNKRAVLDQQKEKYQLDKIYKQARVAIKYLNDEPNRFPKDETVEKHKLFEQNGKWFSEVVNDHLASKAKK